MSAATTVSKKTTAGKAKGSITIKLMKGKIACNPNQRACLNGLGLKNREQTKTLENTPSVRGMIKRVLHLVDVVSQT